MRAQLSVQCGATHAKEDAHLSEMNSQFVDSIEGKKKRRHTFQLAHPIQIIISEINNKGQRSLGTNLGSRHRNRHIGHCQERSGSAPPESFHSAPARAC